MTLQFATAQIGAVLLTINTNCKSTEIDYLLRQSETENIFIIDGVRDTDYVATLYELVPELRTQPRGELRSARYPHLKRVFFLGPEKHRGMCLGAGSDGPGLHRDRRRSTRPARPSSPAGTW